MTRAELMEDVELLQDESDSSEQSPPTSNVNGFRRRVALATVALALLVAFATIGMKFASTPEEADVDKAIEMTAGVLTATVDGLKPIICNPGGQEWSSLSTLSGEVQIAALKGFKLLGAERTRCGLGPLTADAGAFFKGSNGTHTLHTQHKYDDYCYSETYRLSFHINAGSTLKNKSGSTSTAFVLEVNHDFRTKAWGLLSSNPGACVITVGSASEPRVADTKEKFITNVGKFAAAEFIFQLQQHKCMDEKWAKAEAKVVGAFTQVTAGLKINLDLQFSLDGATKIVYGLVVFEDCAKFDKCIRKLVIQGGDVCNAFQQNRRLETSRGSVPEDATDIWAAQRELLLQPGRQLSGERDPLMYRHIKTGAMASSHDPRSNECFKKITVYNQGTCGSCYANGVAQMIGIRLCLLHQSRRLAAENATFGHRSTIDKQMADASKMLDEEEKSAPRKLASCKDDATWSAFGQDEYTCAFFKDKCNDYQDYGQQTHCRESCGLCPKGRQSFSDNPWHGALYQYMPSTGQITPCANSQGQPQGCAGGNLQGVWNNWMRTLTSNLHRMGEDCTPYTYKCWSSSGVVNPVSTGQCAKYADYQLWHKPCNCIPASAQPSSYSCPTAAPSSSCGVPVPPAMFLIKSTPQGLSSADAVLNIQRHIAEYGPIWVSFSCTTGFENNNWKTTPIYTGGGTSEGGHVVNNVGWGSSGGTDYWILRNSWSSSWADNGYCKFGRGWDLDGIESRGLGASMPTTGFADWSAPSCRVTRWSESYSWQGCCTLTKMPTTISVLCNKNANLKIFVSHRITDHKQIYAGTVSGEYRTHAAVANTEFAMAPIDMVPFGFGLQNGDSWINMAATDSSGNKANTDNFVTLNAIAGMTSVA